MLNPLLDSRQETARLLRFLRYFVQPSLFYPKSDIIIAMTWLEIRAYYAALHAQARVCGATQKAIASQRGTGQNSVSRLLSNDRRGPSVEIFVRAVEGLGLSL